MLLGAPCVAGVWSSLDSLPPDCLHEVLAARDESGIGQTRRTAVSGSQGGSSDGGEDQYQQDKKANLTRACEDASHGVSPLSRRFPSGSSVRPTAPGMSDGRVKSGQQRLGLRRPDQVRPIYAWMGEWDEPRIAC